MLATVVIPNFNYGRFLRDAIRSVLSQTHRPIQLIVIDDGSTDDSRQVVLEFSDVLRNADIQYEWLFLDGNRGKLAVLNLAIPLIRGVTTCLLDADDCLFPDFIRSTMHTLFKADTDRRVAFVYTDCQLVDRNLNVLGFGKSVSFDPELLEHASYIPDCGMTLSAELKEASPYDESIRVGTKHHKWLRMVRRGATGLHLPMAAFAYRIHGANMSGITDRLVKKGRLQHSDRLLTGLWPVSCDKSAMGGVQSE